MNLGGRLAGESGVLLEIRDEVWEEREGGCWEEFELELMYTRPKLGVTHANDERKRATNDRDSCICGSFEGILTE